MESKKVAIKELREVTEALLELSLHLARIFRDGYQAHYIASILALFGKDELLKRKLLAAYDGIASVRQEVGDIDLGEAVELAGVLLRYLPELVAVFRPLPQLDRAA